MFNLKKGEILISDPSLTDQTFFKSVDDVMLVRLKEISTIGLEIVKYGLDAYVTNTYLKVNNIWD